MPLLLVVFAPAFLGLLLLLLPRGSYTRAVIILPGVIFAYLLTHIGAVETPSIEIPWIPSLGITLAFYLDGLSLLFALIISGIGTLIVWYSAGYFEKPGEFERFTSYTLLFMTAMLGMVLSSNLLLLFVFWEMTSITSYLLIGFKNEKESAREGARQALLITGIGGLAMLAGILLLAVISGTLDLTILSQHGELLRNHALYAPALILLCLGAFSKSAQFPLHFWLPGAMEAPTPASAYLHSATMVKAGIFLLARLSVSLNGTDLWILLLCGFGLFTFLYGALFALRQTDLKAILAYSTVSWLGVLIALIGLSSKEGAKALVVGIIAHALYKCALFLSAGSIDHAAGTRDITLLGGLYRKMPLSFIGALIAGVSMAGLPPVMGFLAKETLKVASLENVPSAFSLLFPAAAVIGSALTVAVALRILWDTFGGQLTDKTPHPPHEVSWTMWLHPFVLGTLTITLPLTLAITVDPLLNQAITAITGTSSSVHLHLFEGINTPFLLSMLAIGLGTGLFFVRHQTITWLQAQREFNPAALYNKLFLQDLPNGATWLSAKLQHGMLRYYIIVIIMSFVVLIISLIALSTSTYASVSEAAFDDFDWRIAFICTILIIGAISSVIIPTRLGAIVILGIEGALVSVVFALFGAPDLAFTQLMIEVVSIVLFVLAFHFLPDTYTTRPTRIRRFRDMAISASFGLTLGLLVLIAHANRIADPISPYYVENAVPVGQGHNIVNIILVDFRALDTQGEILVLLIAAAGITALLRLRPSDQPRGKHIAQTMEMLAVKTNQNIEDVDAEIPTVSQLEEEK